MEDVYATKRFRLLFTKKVDMKEFFATYSEDVSQYATNRKHKRDGLKALLNIETDEEYIRLCQTMYTGRAKTTFIPKSFVPRRRFLQSWPLYDLDFDSTLTTHHNLKRETKEEKYKRMKSAKYPFKIYLEAERVAEDNTRVKTLQANVDFLVCVRILSLISGKKYTPSQEMWVSGRLTLERIRDRIICQEDFELADPCVQTPDQPNSTRNMDLNKHGMFYIGNTFYVDKRWGCDAGHDYSTEVREWGKVRGVSVGGVEAMETTCLSNLHIRIGYPYLYLHQGKCEHLLIFTDARLVKQTDILFIEDYPLLLSFASCKGRFCVMCLTRLAKLCVTDCDELPYDNAFVCHLCALSYLYDADGNKKCPFRLYKYVDRSAIV